jgi:TonB family protein
MTCARHGHLGTPLVVAISIGLATTSARAQQEPAAPDEGAGADAALGDDAGADAARDDDAAAAGAVEIVPPRLIEDPGAEYPQRARDERVDANVDVVLILDLDVEGRVVHASVETERGHGFDEAALAAARRLRFEPGRRGATKVPTRIRYRYTFAPPTPTRSAAPASREADSGSVAPAPDAGAARGAEDTAIEVTVRGEQLEPAVSSYTRAEVRRIPGAFGDPFRAVETLPGVTPVASGLPFFYVRGAPPGNVGYVLDGVRVPYLYHIGAGPSVVQPAIVQRVDLYPGGYPARFGRFAGGLVSASLTEPRPELHGEGNLRLFDVGALVESGFAAGRGTVLLGGRYSYTAALLSLASPELELDYRDFQTRVSYDLTARDRISVLGFGSYDLLGRERNRVLEILFGTEFYRADVRHDRRLEGGTLRTAVTLGYDRTNAGFLAGDRRNVVDRSVAARSELAAALASGILLRAGGDVAVDAYEVEGQRYGDPDSPESRDFEALFPSRRDHAAGAWLDLVLQPDPSLELTPGVRADVYRSGSATAVGVDPRIAARLRVVNAVQITAAFGLVHQAPSFVLPLPGLTPSLGDGLQRSVQSSAGVEVALDAATTAGTTLFYNEFFAMTDAVGTSDHDGAPDFAERSDGTAFGAELFLRRRLSRRLGGYVSYTLSRSLRRTAGGEFPSAFDRPHVLGAALGYDLGGGFMTGGRFTFYSGAPVQPAADDDAVRRTTDVARERSYYRVDVRLEKRWALRGAAWIAVVLEFLNATLNKETWPGGEEIGPVAIPSVGLEAGF